MNRMLKSFLPFIALLAALACLIGCGNSESDEDSASQAAAQLGLGGDGLADASEALQVQAEGAQPGAWTSDYPAALKAAQELGLPVLVFFNGSDWSIESKTFIQNTLSAQEWLDYLPSLILAYIDLPRHNPKFPATLKEQNETLRQQFGVRNFPSMLLLTAEGMPAGNLRVNSQTTAHELVKNIKLFRRRIPSEIDKLIAQIGREELTEKYASFKGLVAERDQLIRDTQTKVQELETEMRAIGEEVENAIRDWDVARLSPEDQNAYLAAEKARNDAQTELNTLMENAPGRTPENQRQFQVLQQEIQRQQRVIDELTVK